MKHTFVSIKNIITAITLSAALTAIAVPASAKEKKANIELSEAQPTVKYIGSDKHSSLFLVQMDTKETVYFNLVITDADGTVIYRQAYKSKNKFEKYFKLVNEGIGTALNLKFTMEPVIGGEKITYTAMSESPLTSDVVISKY